MAISLFTGKRDRDRYAVFGNPVKHSLSPEIHAMFAQQTGQQLRYRRHEVVIERFAAAVRVFFKGGGKGLNITVPFKQEACALADQLSDRARRAGAVNTLAVLEDGSIYGDNTDGAGLVRDLRENLSWDVRDKRVLILGAGGAVRGVLAPLLKQQPGHLVIANRSVERAVQLAQAFKGLGDIRGCSYESLNGSPFDLIINGTSAGLSGGMPPLPDSVLVDETCCYDMMYGAKPSAFMQWAARQAAWAVSDGLGMLVEQAAESFCIWRGVRPESRPVIDALRVKLSK